MEPIFGVFGIDWKVLVVQIFNFSVLLGVLWYFLYRPLLRLIESRREQIIEGVANAERAEAALKDADAKKAGIIAAASMEADTIIAGARESGKVREHTIVKLAEEKAERIVNEARLQSEGIKRDTLDETKEEVARLIVLGTEKMLREKRNV